MDAMVIAIIVIRLVVPLLMLRWPLIGVLASIAVDGYDYGTLYNSSIGGDNYQYIDKLLDTYFLGIALFVSRRWPDLLARRTMIWLFGYRVLGVVVFFVTGQEYLLLLFPNLVLDFFIFYLIFTALARTGQMVLGARDLAITLLVMLAPKLINEYQLHVYRVMETPLSSALDRFYSWPMLPRMAAYFVLPGLYLLWKLSNQPKTEAKHKS